MTNIMTAQPRPFRPFAALLQQVQLLWAALFVSAFFSGSAYAVNSPAAATPAATPQSFQSALDSHAGTFCSYVNILPHTKWVTLGALIFFLIGLTLLIFGGRGGNVYVMRAIGAIVIIPAALGLASAFGIGC